LGSVVLGVLKVQVVFAVLEELRCSNVHANFDFASVASFCDCLLEKSKSFIVVLDAGSETTFISDVGCVQAVLLLDD
jgi:hypothetical protein